MARPRIVWRALLVAASLGCLQVAWAQQARLLVQSSPLAGFRHHEAPALWGTIREGDPLTLVREPHNVHDRNAVRVDWRGLVLGYVPRAENEAVARQLDRGERLEARVSRLQRTRAPNRRIEFEVHLPFGPASAGPAIGSPARPEARPPDAPASAPPATPEEDPA